MKENSLGSASKQSSFLLFLGLFSSLLGFFREVQIASLYGVSITADMFYIGTLMPEFIIAVMGTASANIFMRQYHLSQRRKDFAFSIFVLLGILLSVLAVGLFISFPWLVKLLAPGFSTADLHTLTKLGRIMLGSLVSSVFFGVISASMNMNGKFYLSGLHGLLYNVILIATTFALVPFIGIYGLAWSYLGANVIRIVFMLPFAWPYFGRFDWRMTVSFWRELPKGTTTYVLTGLQQILERSFATNIQAGAVSALSYAGRISNLPILLFMNSVLTVMYPRMIKQAEEKEKEQLGNTVMLTMKIVVFSLVFIELYLLLFRESLFSFLFEYGKFGAKDTQTLSGLLILFAPVVLLAGINQVLLKTAHAIGKNMLTAISLSIALSTYIVSALLLHHFGTDSLVLALLLYNGSMLLVLWTGITKGRKIRLVLPIQLKRWYAILAAGAINGVLFALLPQTGLLTLIVYSGLYFLLFGLLLFLLDQELRLFVQGAWSHLIRRGREKSAISVETAEG